MTELTAPIFLVGVPRSGTTIVHEALAAHEAMGWIPSSTGRFPRAFPLDASPRLLGVPGLAERLRGEKRQHGQGRGLANRLLPKPAEAYARWEWMCGPEFTRGYLRDTEPTPAARRRTRRSLARLLSLQGKPRLLVKLTGPSRMRFLRALFPDARFVHIVRDPRAVVHSLLEVPFWREGGGLEKPWWSGGLAEGWEDEWRAHGGSAAALAALQWRRILEVAGEEAKALEPGRYTELRYRDFVRDPHASVARVLELAELPPSATLDRYLGDGARYRNLNARHVAALASEERRAVDAITADWLEAFGDPDAG